MHSRVGRLTELTGDDRFFQTECDRRRWSRFQRDGTKTMRAANASIGVILDNKLSFKEHLECCVLNRVSCSLYALKVLRSKGLDGVNLWDVTSQTLVARMLYASQAWWGFLRDESSHRRLEAPINKLKKLKFLPKNYKSFRELGDLADTELFNNALSNMNHVLQHLLPPKKVLSYGMRKRAHNRCIPGHLNYYQANNFIYRMLSKDSY